MAMRLTLRTLLAYLDDTLDGKQTRHIGEKVAESDVAQEQVDRIRKVVRKRSLSTPPVSGDGPDDPNSVAEYLDNVLPGEELERIESNALDSDVHLAEIAAAHQILTLVEGEPAHVPPTARQRMYKLVKGRESIPYRKPTTPAVASIDPEEYDPESTEADRTLLMGLPAYARQQSWLRRLAPLFGLFLMIAALAVAVRQSVPPDPGPPASVPEGRAFVLLSPRGAPEPEPGVAPRAKAAPGAKAAPKAGVGPGPKEKEKEAGPGPKEEEPEPIPAPKVEPEPKRPLLPPPAAEPSDARQVAGEFVSRDTVLLRRPSEQAPWQRVPLAQPAVSTAETLMSLPGYHSEIALNGGVRLLLWGNLPEFLEVPLLESEVVLHAPAPGVDVDMTLRAGRVFLSGGRPDRPTHVRLRFAGEVWDVTLPDDRTELSLDLIGRYPPGVGFSKEPGGEGPQKEFYLGVLRGSADVRFDRQEYLDVKGPALIAWDSKGAGAAKPQVFSELPAFWNRTVPTHELAQRSEAALRELSRRLSGPDVNVSVVLAEAVAERPDDPTDREELIRTVHLRTLAVYCLQAVGNIAALVDALGDSNYADVRRAAVTALRHWIGGGPGRDLKLHKVLTEQKGYTEGQADQVLQLLHSFSAEQVKDPALYSALIDFLDREKIAIRELAYWHLLNLDPLVGAEEDPMKYFFDAGAPQDVRREAIKAWRERIPEGKLPPSLRQ